MMAESRERGFFGDVVIIHDRGGPRPAPPNLKPWRMCSVVDCGEMAFDRNGEGFTCASHAPKAEAVN